MRVRCPDPKIYPYHETNCREPHINDCPTCHGTGVQPMEKITLEDIGYGDMIPPDTKPEAKITVTTDGSPEAEAFLDEVTRPSYEDTTIPFTDEEINLLKSRSMELTPTPDSPLREKLRELLKTEQLQTSPHVTEAALDQLEALVKEAWFTGYGVAKDEEQSQ